MTEEYIEEYDDTEEDDSLGYLEHRLVDKGPRESARGYTAEAIRVVDREGITLPELVEALPDVFKVELLEWIRAMAAKENKKQKERGKKFTDRIMDKVFMPGILRILVSEERKKNPGLSIDEALRRLSEEHPHWGKGCPCPVSVCPP
jgi:hypothetical protein